jgi:hypothetical protein
MLHVSYALSCPGEQTRVTPQGLTEGPLAGLGGVPELLVEDQGQVHGPRRLPIPNVSSWLCFGPDFGT